MPAKKTTLLPPATYADRYADMLLGTIASKRQGIPQTFVADSPAYLCRLRSIHRDDATTADAIARVREFATELGIYFESVSRVKSKIRQSDSNQNNDDPADILKSMDL